MKLTEALGKYKHSGSHYSRGNNSSSLKPLKQRLPVGVLKEIAKRTLDDPTLPYNIEALRLALGIESNYAYVLKHYWIKLCEEKESRFLCYNCLGGMIFDTTEIICKECGLTHSFPIVPHLLDESHEGQSTAWGLGSYMQEYELRQISPCLNKVYSDKIERIKEQIRFQIVEVLKGYSFGPEVTSAVSNEALKVYHRLMGKGIWRIYKAVVISFVLLLKTYPLLYLPLREYSGSGPYSFKSSPRKKDFRLDEAFDGE